jgi:hypothetical protein
MFKTPDNLPKVTSSLQRSRLTFRQEESEIDQESTLWHLIKDEYASTVVGGRSQFHQALITEVDFPSLDSLNREELSSGVNQATHSNIIFLNNCKPGGCTIKNY